MESVTDTGFWELLSYIVTVIGLPLAIVVFAVEQRRERQNEEDAVYESLSDNYQEFLRVVLEHPDLQLVSQRHRPALDAEQRERMMVIFGMLIALFERAYLLLYEHGLRGAKLRRWHSWEDYMLEWCERAEFREALESLLVGEDAAFCDYIRALALRQATRAAAAAPTAPR